MEVRGLANRSEVQLIEVRVQANRSEGSGLATRSEGLANRSEVWGLGWLGSSRYESEGFGSGPAHGLVDKGEVFGWPGLANRSIELRAGLARHGPTTGQHPA